MNNEIIVSSIKNLCKSNNITVGELERTIGLSQGLVSKWSKTTPSLDKIIDIADYFHVTLDKVVGYSDNIDDTFLKVLCDWTKNSQLKWNWDTKSNDKVEKLRIYKSEYDSDQYTEISYFCKYNEGYIIIYYFGEYNDSLNPIELELYVQPSDNSSSICQKYNTNQLISLWVAILKQLSDNAPDDIKAEELKLQIIQAYDKSKK